VAVVGYDKNQPQKIRMIGCVKVHLAAQIFVHRSGLSRSTRIVWKPLMPIEEGRQG
jgi:hypothetical protein